MKTRAVYFSAVVFAAIVLSACAGTNSQAPEVSHDGLHLVDDTSFQSVYLKPGVDLSVYKKYGVTECQVAFRKNWLRDQNQSRLQLTNRVTQKDMDRIKGTLGADCTQKFRDALTAAPAYEIVEEFTEGEEVLILEPNIINLDVHAPQTNYPGIERTYTTSSGEMTLYLELVDATTEEVLARVVDRRKDPDDHRMTWTNSVTNKANADRILNRWAGQLRDGLDRITNLPLEGS
ncbi:DUF3313 family protein [Seongchinamella unica]|uniref:DUF3313 family protein n=1 Tax=Seongchinamella unica TaxID=2547392 RepID=A0A4R5LSV5_9GAMM|nr:DUF3313 family protein [Seongchinamella unica]TDG13817.1 DUF3313 family protein [Seongchinamella unica]